MLSLIHLHLFHVILIIENFSFGHLSVFKHGQIPLNLLFDFWLWLDYNSLLLLDRYVTSRHVLENLLKLGLLSGEFLNSTSVCLDNTVSIRQELLGFHVFYLKLVEFILVFFSPCFLSVELVLLLFQLSPESIKILLSISQFSLFSTQGDHDFILLLFDILGMSLHVLNVLLELSDSPFFIMNGFVCDVELLGGGIEFSNLFIQALFEVFLLLGHHS